MKIMTRNDDQHSRLAEQIELACLIEATARKPGNVHPGASFDDLTYDDFVAAARITAPILAQSANLGVGRAVLEAVNATVAETGTNVNLGICLLIAPLAAVPQDQSLKSGIPSILKNLTVYDAKLVYEAIRLAQPGGLGEAPEQDVRNEPTQTLLEVMKLAADRDGIAAEYARGFRLTQLIAAAWFQKFLHDYQQQSADAADLSLPSWEFVTIGVQMSLLMMQSDTLIRRKCGDAIFHETACRAEYVSKAGLSLTPEGQVALTEFDAWLRSGGHLRNPGTTADLIAAIWFIAIREGLVAPPSKDEIFSHAARINNADRM
jgi:triphosphoribosyl-dephospho-CoA synthase